MEDIEKIKDRIAKLLAMADDAASPNEAAIAAQRARALMDKHQLDAFDVQGRVKEEFGTSRATRAYAAIPQYMAFLATAVAKYNDCQAAYEADFVDFKKKAHHTKQVGKVVYFRGYKYDCELAVDMYVRLLAAIDRLCKTFLQARGYAKYPVRIGGQFKMGCVLTICDRLAKLTKERDAITSTSTGTSLVLVKKNGVEEHFGEAKYRETAPRNADRDREEHQARVQGHIKGKTVEILPSIEEGEEEVDPDAPRIAS